jgi:hypothetical protein
MNKHDPTLSKSPEEHEIETKKEELSRLSEELAQKELDLEEVWDVSRLLISPCRTRIMMEVMGTHDRLLYFSPWLISSRYFEISLWVGFLYVHWN